MGITVYPNTFGDINSLMSMPFILTTCLHTVCYKKIIKFVLAIFRESLLT